MEICSELIFDHIKFKWNLKWKQRLLSDVDLSEHDCETKIQSMNQQLDQTSSIYQPTQSKIECFVNDRAANI